MLRIYAGQTVHSDIQRKHNAQYGNMLSFLSVKSHVVVRHCELKEQLYNVHVDYLCFPEKYFVNIIWV